MQLARYPTDKSSRPERFGGLRSFQPDSSPYNGSKTRESMEKIKKSEAEGRAQLTDEQYHVAREKGTERAFTGEYNQTKDKGVYTCVCCGQELFDSSAKFESGTGWPSFIQLIKKENVDEEFDDKFGMRRTEVLCSRCDAHLGHVFPDGPKPTGMRYCMNSASLKLNKK